MYRAVVYVPTGDTSGALGNQNFTAPHCGASTMEDVALGANPVHRVNAYNCHRQETNETQEGGKFVSLNIPTSIFCLGIRQWAHQLVARFLLHLVCL
jgi:hypothetical protein